ncbi:MAG: (2Fe-2S)-binding protein [bacterium]
MPSTRFKIRINGQFYEIECDADRLLIDVIREDLRLTGTKRGCGIGACGACTVLIDGKPRRSCRVKISEIYPSPTLPFHPPAHASGYFLGHPPPVGSRPQSQRGGKVPLLCKEGSGEVDPAIHTCHESRITTIEGLELNGKLHPIQQAFIDCGAIQCGFCTPGMVLTAKSLLDDNPQPTRDDIKKALAGNLCRCTGYQQIFDAIEKAAKTYPSFVRRGEGR